MPHNESSAGGWSGVGARRGHFARRPRHRLNATEPPHHKRGATAAPAQVFGPESSSLPDSPVQPGRTGQIDAAPRRRLPPEFPGRGARGAIPSPAPPPARLSVPRPATPCSTSVRTGPRRRGGPARSRCRASIADSTIFESGASSLRLESHRVVGAVVPEQSLGQHLLHARERHVRQHGRPVLAEQVPTLAAKLPPPRAASPIASSNCAGGSGSRSCRCRDSRAGRAIASPARASWAARGISCSYFQAGAPG